MVSILAPNIPSLISGGTVSNARTATYGTAGCLLDFDVTTKEGALIKVIHDQSGAPMGLVNFSDYIKVITEKCPSCGWTCIAKRTLGSAVVMTDCPNCKRACVEDDACTIPIPEEVRQAVNRSLGMSDAAS